MNFFLADILISKDKDVDLNIKKQILIKGLDLINKELKTSKTNNSCLTVSLRFINIRNMKKLNYSFSGSNKETNVLSFLPDPKEHGSDREASKMEQIEKNILSKLGIEDPYLIEL